LRRVPVLLFNGKLDFVVRPLTMRNLEHQLHRYIDGNYIFPVFGTYASHVWSVDTGSCPCGACMVTGSNLCCDVNNCAYNLSGDMLRRIYGPELHPRVQPKPHLYWINQWRFLPVPNITAHKAQLLKWAMVYVPVGCEKQLDGCRVHLNYHGCTPRSWKQRRLWVLSIGVNEYAEANNIVIVYPQAGGNPDVGAGCWNWLPYNAAGFHDPHFDTHEGAQLRTITNMVDSLDWALKEATVVPNDFSFPPDGEEKLLDAHGARGTYI